jgi:hypothetical protein
LNEAVVQLLISWSDPKALGAGIIALTLVGVIAVLMNQKSNQTASSASAGASATAGAASSSPDPQPTPSTPEQLKQRAESADTSLSSGEGETVAEMLASETFDDTELLSRFVRDADGEEVGETMTVTEDEVVVKQDGEFFAVDPQAIIEKNGNLVLDPNVDWDEARERGEAWREANLDRMQYDEEGLPADD